MQLQILIAHEGHAHSEMQWVQWLGKWHLIFIHFPIALIVMTVISECLLWKTKNLFFDNASRFMLWAAAFSTIPTVLTGFAFSYGVTYEGEMASIFWWHRFIGLFVAVFAFITIIIRELTARKRIKSIFYYLISLFILLVGVCLSCYFGGVMTFGY